MSPGFFGGLDGVARCSATSLERVTGSMHNFHWELTHRCDVGEVRISRAETKEHRRDADSRADPNPANDCDRAGPERATRFEDRHGYH